MSIRKYKRRIQVLAGLLLFILVAGVIVSRVLLEPILSFLIEQKLESRLDARVVVEDLDFRFSGDLHVGRLSIYPEGLSGEFVRFEGVHVECKPGALLTGGFPGERIFFGNVEAMATPELFQWAAGIGKNGDFSDFPAELEIGGGTIDTRLADFVKPVNIKGLRFSAVRGDDGRFFGAASFSAGKNDVKITFNAAPEQGWIETDLLLDGFDLSFFPLPDIAGPGIDPARIKVRGTLSGTATFLTSSGQWFGDFALSGITAGHPEHGLVVTHGKSGLQISGDEVLFYDGNFHMAGGWVAIFAAP